MGLPKKTKKTRVSGLLKNGKDVIVTSSYEVHIADPDKLKKQMAENYRKNNKPNTKKAPKTPEEKKKERDERFRRYSSDLKKAMKEGNLSQMTTAYAGMAKIQFDEGAYSDALDLACYGFYYRLHLSNSMQDYRARAKDKKWRPITRISYIFTPRMPDIETLQKLEKKQIYERDEIVNHLDTLNKDSLINGPISLKDGKKILMMCLDGELDKAAAETDRLHDKYWKAKWL